MGRYLRPNTHPMVVEADRLWSRLNTARVNAEDGSGDWWRLLRVQSRAEARFWRRMERYHPRTHKNKMGRAPTQDRPYAVGGRGRRGW